MDISEKDLNNRISGLNPRRGEVYRLEIDDAQGYEQKGDEEGMCLAVVVSNNYQNAKKNVIVVVPLSSKVKKIYPFQVATFFQGKPGKAKCEQVRDDYDWKIYKKDRWVNRKRDKWDWGKVGFGFKFGEFNQKESSNNSLKIFKFR